MNTLFPLKIGADLNLAVDRMEGEFQKLGPVPEVLRWRESDAELGLPSLYPAPKDPPPIWDRPVDVNQLRGPKWSIYSAVVTEDEETVTVRKIVPSEAARARADEIIAAYEKQIGETRAATLAGMPAKVRCAQAYAESDEIDNIGDGDCAEVMAIAIFHDIQRLAKSA